MNKEKYRLEPIDRETSKGRLQLFYNVQKTEVYILDFCSALHDNGFYTLF